MGKQEIGSVLSFYTYRTETDLTTEKCRGESATEQDVIGVKMSHLIMISALFLLNLVLDFPLTRKPLSEDDGNWYYLPVFRKRGVQLFKNYNIIGYFGVQWVSTKLYSLLGFENPKFFYYLKILWYSLNSVSIYWLTYCFWHTHILSFIAGAVFAVITAIPNTLLVLTYAEHFFILPINLSIIFFYYGIITGNLYFFALAGLMSAWAVQIKPTALLFILVLLSAFYFAPSVLLSLVCYLLIFIGLNLLPLAIVRKHGRKAQTNYLTIAFGPIVILINIFLDKLKLESLKIRLPESLKPYDAYIKNHHSRNSKAQWAGVKKSILPVIKDLYLILILAAAQIILLFVDFDPFAFAMIMLLTVLLLIVFFQKNYYTPHFNPCWAPISVLAANTIWDMWPHLLNSGALGLAMMAFVGVESIKIGRIIIKSFSKSEIDNFGFMGPVFGMLFRLAESIGGYIQRHSEENEKLFVWGDQPSVYLYAKREAFDTDYLFLYAHHGRILQQRDLLDSLRERPPELLLFYNYKVNDGWNIEKLQKLIGVPYNFLRSFTITNNQGRTLRDLQGIIYDFPLYRRDDAKYKELLLERALLAKRSGDINTARKHLNAVLKIFPEDYEASIRLCLLGNNADDARESRGYLEEQLSVADSAYKHSIIQRLLAEMDLGEGDLNMAMHRYEEALAINPSDFRTHNGLGEVLFSLNNIEQALESFKKALELNLYSADTLNNLGVVLASIGRVDKARDYFNRALSFMPEHPDARENMEQIHQ